MKYLLDTNIIIDLFHGVEEVTSRLEKIEEFGVAVSTISLAELYLGAEISTNKKKNEKKIDSFLRTPSVSVLDFTKKSAKEYGILLGKLQKKGIKLAEVDTMIAATAKLYGLKVLTKDKKHFERLKKFGVKVEVV
jgi:tRNA(fMet)-specific endonuclease VapC